MPYHLRKTPQCKYCNKLVKHNIVKGRNKGYCATCGTKKCLSKAYRNPEVRKKKRYILKGITQFCNHCKKEFIKESYNQISCKICAPTKAAVTILRRYKISYPEYCKILKENPNCAICLRILENPVIDHNHKTGKIRGIICNHCNVSLNLIENKEKLERALNYLNIKL